MRMLSYNMQIIHQSFGNVATFMDLVITVRNSKQKLECLLSCCIDFCFYRFITISDILFDCYKKLLVRTYSVCVKYIRYILKFSTAPC